jgi:hypothetical protein
MEKTFKYAHVCVIETFFVSAHVCVIETFFMWMHMCVLDKKEQQDMHMFSSLVAHLLAVAHLIAKILKKKETNSVAHVLVGCATEFSNSVAHLLTRCATNFFDLVKPSRSPSLSPHYLFLSRFPSRATNPS